MFEQLGLLDEITRVSFPRKSMDIYKEDLTLISSMLQGELKEKYDPMLQLHVKKNPAGIKSSLRPSSPLTKASFNVLFFSLFFC